MSLSGEILPGTLCPMARLVVDLHLHSRFSMGTSPSLDLAALADGARRTGVDLIAAPDFTHPAWLAEMRSQLKEAGDGVYRLRPEGPRAPGARAGKSAGASQGRLSPARQEIASSAPLFMFATEVSCVWTESSVPAGRGSERTGLRGPSTGSGRANERKLPAGSGSATTPRGRRVHLLVFAPGIEAVEKLNRALAGIADLASDGRPTLNIPARQFAEIAWQDDDRFVIVPAHAWTPWYGIYGSKSGFDSIEECFGSLAPRIFAIETGLSSDPAMNWRIADVDSRAIVSFSDAHSPPSMGREATVLDCEPDFPSFVRAIKSGGIVETLEFHPGHGKYHLDGHRKCGVRFTPKESAATGGRCPECGRKLTLGVLNRIEDLAVRPESIAAPLDKGGVVRGPQGHPPFRYMVPLREVLSQALGAGPSSQKVARAYDALTLELGGELNVLMDAPARDIERVAGDCAAAAVLAARHGEVDIDEGYDGEYGTVRVRYGQAR